MATIALERPAAQIRPWIRRLVRLGYAAKGVIYLLVGTLAVQLALGDGGRITDKQGVLGDILQLPFGTLLLATTGIGWQALRIVMGAGQERSRGPEGYASDVLQFPFGDWALVLIGLGIAIHGGYDVWRAARSRLDDDMDHQQLRREGLGWVLAVGRAGIGARGVVFAMMGVLLMRAGVDRRPSEAGGMADSLTALLSQPFGSILLGATAAGLMCYGVWQLLHARYARI